MKTIKDGEQLKEQGKHMSGPGSIGWTDRLNTRQRLIVSLLLAILVIDGIDIGILSVAAPKIIAEWRLPTASFGIALSAAVAGMAVGSVMGGWLGDRFGRKAVLLGSIAVFGTATMFSSIADGVAILAMLRFLSGVGFGAASPAAIALAAEWLPANRRSRVGSLMAMGAPLGVMLASYLGLLVLSSVGWRGTFVAFGLLTLVIGVLSIFLVPESAAYLRGQGKDAKADRLERAVFGDIETPTSGNEKGAVHASGSLFREHALWRFNAGAWLAFFTSSYVTYTLASWLPVLLQGMGFSFTAAVHGLFFMTMMALIGTAIAGRFVLWLGSRFASLIIVAAALIFSLTFYLLARQQIGVELAPLIYMLCAGLGLTQGSIAGALYGLVSVRYPTPVRSTGIGIALMSAKIGGVVAVLIGGWLLDGGSNPQAQIIASFSLAVIALGASILLIDRHLPPQRRSAGAA
jgi:MFS transporter, AAHS family, 4-hydroxybenzoate transporter